MKIAESRTQLREWRDAVPEGRIGFVPTMGALHDGHRSLLRAARAECDWVVASVYVNPTQFGPNEDFDSYPRTRASDEAALREEGVDLAWFASSSDVYPPGFATEVQVPTLADRLCGLSRPGHFSGVTTVVLKLLNSVRPDRAYFGRKDYQQYVLIRRMARDLDLPVEIVPCPIVRESDGLAMSSRNVNLSARGRTAALALRRGLLAAQELFANGERSGEALVIAAAGVIGSGGSVALEYLELVDPETLAPVGEVVASAVLAVAARVEKVRLIDNIDLPASESGR